MEEDWQHHKWGGGHHHEEQAGGPQGGQDQVDKTCYLYIVDKIKYHIYNLYSDLAYNVK